MATGTRVTCYFTDEEKLILDSTASRLGISRSEVIRHLVIYQGLCGGEFPITKRILELPVGQRKRVMAEIAAKTAANDPVKPQAFRQWAKEVMGNDDSDTLEIGAERLIQDLLAK